MKLLQRIGLLLLLSSSTLPVAAQVPVELAERLDHTLDSMRTVTNAVSFSAAIQFSDGAIWAHADGTSAMFPHVAVDTDDAYLIGSVTKTITSACILQMAEQGLLSLDDSLHEWLDTMDYINPNITIRQLLQHTSGLYDVLSHPHNQDSLMADMSRRWTPEELIARFMMPPPAAPGATWAYCNTNYFLLSMIIKRITGNPFYTELRSRFFVPNGLSTFAIPAFEPLASPVAHLWMDITGDGIKDDAHSFYMNYLSLNSTAGAAGGYFATPTDCTKWMRKYMRGDILSPATMAQAKTVVPAAGSQGGYYGLGLMKNQTSFLGYLAYGHGGDLAYHASSWYFPEKDASITVFTNDNNKDSWALLPVVRELLRTYNKFTTSVVPITTADAVSIQAYPDPFTDRITVSLSLKGYTGDLSIALQDIYGRTISTQNIMHSTGSDISVALADLAPLPCGIYFVSVNAADGSTKTLKVSK